MLVILELKLELEIRVGSIHILNGDFHAVLDIRAIDRGCAGDRSDSADLNGFRSGRAHDKTGGQSTCHCYRNNLLHLVYLLLKQYLKTRCRYCNIKFFINQL